MGKIAVAGVRVASGAVAFNSMGTGPAVASIDGGTSLRSDAGLDPEIVDLTGEGDLVIRVAVTAGTGTPAIANNNIVITLPSGVNPRRVFLENDAAAAPKFYVHSISNNVITIGSKVAPAVSTTYTLTLICVT